MTKKIPVVKQILNTNDQVALENEQILDENNIFALNLMASPGAGKTSFILATSAHLQRPLSPGVIEGDLASSIDADKIAISAVTRIELTSALTRRHLDKSIDKQSYNKALKEFETELNYFEIIPFDEHIEKSAVKIIKKQGMKTLDAIQLASATLSKADKLITSDKRLLNNAKKNTSMECTFL